VTAAVGHGKRAARHIDAWVRGSAFNQPPKHPVIGFTMLNLPIYTDAEPSRQRELPPAERIGGFDEILAGLSEREVIHEARRCLSCGNCFECDHCYAACPEDAIVKLGPGNRYRFDYTKCTGCAVCFEQCPCHAIEMIAEPA
jgi:Pyruvate/2-oxoacid:ferredoxin oxidoreductase delta subunit